MWPFARKRLDVELVEILRDQKLPINLDQLVHQLFHRRERISDLLVLSRSAMRRKQRLRRRVEKCLEAGLASKSLVRGQWVYLLEPAKRSVGD